MNTSENEYEVRALRLRIDAVDLERIQLQRDRWKMVNAYGQLETLLRSVEKERDNYKKLWILEHGDMERDRDQWRELATTLAGAQKVNLKVIEALQGCHDRTDGKLLTSWERIIVLRQQLDTANHLVMAMPPRDTIIPPTGGVI